MFTPYVQVNITTNAVVALQPPRGLPESLPGKEFLGLMARATPGTSFSQVMPLSVWEDIQPALNSASNFRVPARVNSVAVVGKTMPAIIYDVQPLPGGRPTIHRVATGGTNLSIGGTDQTVTLYGEDLIPGNQASYTFYNESQGDGSSVPGPTAKYGTRTAILRVAALRKGPGGRTHRLRINAATGAGSAVVTTSANGDVLLTVTPAAGSDTATAIAAQINAGIPALYFSATALVGAAKVRPTLYNLSGVGAAAAGQQTYVELDDPNTGEGSGIAYADICVSGEDPTNRVRIEAIRPGCKSNGISIIILASQGANAVTVSGNTITVTRTAAATAIATIASAINGSATAAALVKATAVGAGNLSNVTQTWLYHGGGEEPVVKVAGVAVNPTTWTDTSIVAVATGASLAALSGVAAGQGANVTITAGLTRFTASIATAA